MATRYLVFRHGSNSTNQHMCERMPVGIYEARNGADACEMATESGVSVYANQRLTYLAESKVRTRALIAAWNAVLEDDVFYVEKHQ